MAESAPRMAKADMKSIWVLARSCTSTACRSDEKRLMMRPSGVTSKNPTGEPLTPQSAPSCSWRLARIAT